MSPRQRQHDKHLPQNVRLKHNAYYFVKNQKWTRLGSTLSEAMQKWAEINQGLMNNLYMDGLFDRYLTDIAPQKAKRTYIENVRYVANLRVFFGAMRPEDVKPTHVYRYKDLRGQTSKSSANRELELLSHLFNCAIEWGFIIHNPCRGVKHFPEARRSRYITDEEFTAVHGAASPLFQCLMEMAYLTGLRRGDIIRIKRADLTPDGIQVNIHKTNRKLLIEWTDELRAAVEKSKRLWLTITSFYLFCNSKGKPYSDSGISAMWQRLINKAVKKGVITEHFRFHDIRRKAATDAENKHGREFARVLLGHTTQTMTARYIAGMQRVKPVK